jgi:predicted metal-dependent hydrolase
MAQRKPMQLELVLGNGPAQIATRHQFRLDEQCIEYTLKRSLRRRSITFVVDEDGLRVGAPWHATQHRIESLLDKHARWISRKLGEWRARRPPPFTWREGTAVMALGEPLTLAFDPARPATARDGNLLCVTADEQTGSGVLAARVTAWLRSTAQTWFEQRAAHYAPVLGVPLPAIHLSNAKSRWGSCHPDGRVRLNWRLIQMPPDLIDYVVVHELAHLREPNHSQSFWRWVASVLPDYQQRRRALRHDSHRYLLA